MPCDRKLYPKDWPATRVRILARARNCCERCGAENGSEIIYATNGRRRYTTGRDSASWIDRHGQMCPTPHADEYRKTRNAAEQA